ncbi:MFS transporter [Pseudonocardia sp. DSM 110487]|uniref:MFS transporter n=1 Tax=Pseudonocardia sp. DSM 110487 TaxID=2865833 RepID=UPI001C69F69A|nr:MFS transporter [Pseudonocardia sp. DSM 110487]QYN32654.1 MFS transporter [Pseudonocardia sp. DSM 110487]
MPKPASIAIEDTPTARRVWLAAWPVMAVFVLSNAPTPLYVVWADSIGFSAGVLTAVFAAYIGGLLAALLVAGVVSDRVGRKPVLVPAVALAIVACVLFATAGSVLMLALARFLAGIAVGATVSAGMAAVTDLAGAGLRRLAALASSSAMVLGAGSGPLLAGVLSEAMPGPTVTIFVVEIVLLASALVAVIRMRLPRADRSAAARAWIRVPSVHPQGRTAVLLGIAVFAPGITATSFVLSLGPSVLAELLATTNRIVAGALAFVMFLAAAGVQFAAQRFPVRAVLLAGAASTVASMTTLVLSLHASSIALLAVAAVLAGAGQGMGQLGGLTSISANVPSARLAEANAALNVGGYVPAAVLPLTAGFVSDATGLVAGSTGFAVVMVIAALAGAGIVAARTRTSAP